MRFTIGVVLGMLVGLLEVSFLMVTQRRRLNNEAKQRQGKLVSKHIPAQTRGGRGNQP